MLISRLVRKDGDRTTQNDDKESTEKEEKGIIDTKTLQIINITSAPEKLQIPHLPKCTIKRMGVPDRISEQNIKF